MPLKRGCSARMDSSVSMVILPVQWGGIVTHFAHTPNWQGDIISLTQFRLYKQLDGPVFKRYILRVAWLQGKACFPGAFDGEKEHGSPGTNRAPGLLHRHSSRAERLRSQLRSRQRSFQK